MVIRPLTRRNRDGKVDERSVLVEQQITEALALTPAALVARAEIRDHGAPGFLQEESLVYLIRENLRQGHDQLADQLAQILLRRCARFVHDKLRALGSGEADDAYAEVINKLILLIADQVSDRGDFLQVKFWVVLERLATTAFKRYLNIVKRAAMTVPLSTLAGEEMELNGDDEDTRSAPLENRPDDSVAVADEVVLRDELDRAQEGLALIEEPYRTAFILRHFYGWPIQDKDPDMPTISRYFSKTPRTIKNWLDKAEEALEAWRGARA